MQLKICGVCDSEAMRFCADSGIPFVGLNLISWSKRYINLADAIRLNKAMLEKPATTQSVLIVEDISSEFLQILAKQWLQAFGQLPIIQVYNRVLTHAAFDLSEMRKFARDIWVATTWGDVTESIQILQKVRGSVLLLDSATPGSGKVFDWGLLSTDLLSKVTWGLAGGVNPENIDDAIRLRPWLIDISSGVESAPRIKDFAKIKYIWERIRAAPKE